MRFLPWGGLQSRGKEKHNIQQEKSNNKEFAWNVIGAQKTFSVTDLACGFFHHSRIVL